MSNSQNPRISVVIPTLNEAANLRHVLPLLSHDYELVLVDGGSVDGTIDAAREIRGDIRIIKQTRKGKGNALACGFEAATGDIIVMFDADGSADADEIPRFVDALLAGADFAKGSRFTAGGGSHDITPLRRAGNGGLHLVANTLFGTKFSDLCYGYNAFWRDLVPVLDLPVVDQEDVAPGEMLWGDGFEIETIINCRFAEADVRIQEVPSVELARIYGQSNLRTFSDGFRVLRTLFTERLRARKLAKNSIPRPDRRTNVARTDMDLEFEAFEVFDELPYQEKSA
ncbi:glycosyltransferase family 2 protein [Rhodococcus sp. RS1C4]|uniref:glycosyltransferase family 2 protein n=1 Tax=Rhodococcoides fascians TaxID=1828 RepID=UPI000566C92D|nr:MULTISPECIES: glycosyltransferase family 2 protein [Rhodococcus]OZC49909.1 glycosyltransferase family 2 protein [Rhodococcus sp. RS1C4]OZC60154.1 glycosyltransferase family 2 protein [Rhodococcus sp. 06-621-2]OZD58336.1 glycosyltransferase family 2 protein [Rhodococcus sp. 06-1059B-a]OZE84818.1 glycosyltransferase family 2 protein [Rhodococcus sp. 15-649-1-2]OZF07410.1 glycosyltransferase family 2 protein [Rhodococcus sp. 15-1154-1]